MRTFFERTKVAILINLKSILDISTNYLFVINELVLGFPMTFNKEMNNKYDP